MSENEPTVERPVVHLMIPLLDDRAGCCGRPLADMPTDGSHLVTHRPLYKTCDGHGKVRENPS